MDINDKACIHWAYHRGMHELDISIMSFFEHEYDSLSDGEEYIFIRLLECDNPDLFNWLMNHGEPVDEQLEQMVRSIQTRNRECGPVTIWFTRVTVRAMAFTANSWAGRGICFIDALVIELHPIMADFALSGGVRQRSQPASSQRLPG